MRIRSGDTVKILYGKDAGSVGKVLKVLTKKEMVVVEGLNSYKKHLKGDGQTRKSEIVTVLKPLHFTKVQLVSPDGKSTRVSYEVKDGVKTRVAVRGGAVLDLKAKKVKKNVKSSVKDKKSVKSKK